MGEALQIRLRVATRQEAAHARWPLLIRSLADETETDICGLDMARRLPRAQRLSLDEAEPLVQTLFRLEESLGTWQTETARQTALALEACLDRHESLLHNREGDGQTPSPLPSVLELETVAVFWNPDLLPRLWPALAEALDRQAARPPQLDDMMQVVRDTAGDDVLPQRTALVEDLLRTRQELLEACAGNDPRRANQCSDQLEEQLSRLDAMLPGGGRPARRRWLSGLFGRKG